MSEVMANVHVDYDVKFLDFCWTTAMIWESCLLGYSVVDESEGSRLKPH